MDELQTSFRCIAVDLPGHGRSPGNGPGTYGRDLVLDDLRRVMDHCEMGPAVLVGHSLGGYLSLALAIEDPARVCGLGLVGAGPGFRNPDSLEQWNDSVRSLVAERDLPDGMEVISMHVDSMVMDRMGEIEAPVLIATSPQDHVVDPVNSEVLAASVSGPVRTITLDDSFHVATQDHDQELLIVEMLSFIKEVTS